MSISTTLPIKNVTLGGTSIPIDNHITVGEQLAFTITDDYYYPGGTVTTPIAYNGWSITDIKDVSGYQYIVVAGFGGTSWPSYSYNNGTTPTFVQTVTVNGLASALINLNTTTAIGFSNATSALKSTNFKVYPVSDYHILPLEIRTQS